MVLEDDLRDACKPGDRVAVCGVYKPVAPRANGSVSGVFKAVVVANAVAKLSRDACGPVFSEEDYDNITVRVGTRGGGEVNGEGGALRRIGG